MNKKNDDKENDYNKRCALIGWIFANKNQTSI